MKKGALLFIFILVSFSALAQVNEQHENNISQIQRASKKVKVFPNPATNVVNILGLTNSSRSSITILDISGNQVLHYDWEIRNNAVSIPIPNLNPGIYVARIESAEEQVQTRFYKK